jgi:hypothetical protein
MSLNKGLNCRNPSDSYNFDLSYSVVYRNSRATPKRCASWSMYLRRARGDGGATLSTVESASNGRQLRESRANI